MRASGQGCSGGAVLRAGNAGDRRFGRRLSRSVALATAAAVLSASAVAGSADAQPTSPPPGKIGRTYSDSIPFPPARTPARAGAPNVLVWMIDDVGFGQIGAFGGLIETPNIDAVAKRGIEYTNFHATPICSASRAAFLTGRNSHEVHVGSHAGAAADFPGYDAHVPADAGTLAENLHAAGYLTYAVGKWDHLPSEDVTASGPFTYWPSNQGFDRFYGFLSAEADEFHPTLWSDHLPVEPPAGLGYHMSADLADHAIDWITSRDANSPRRPFFMYWATGAAHAPHHAPDAYLAHYRGRFDMGWDKAREMILQRQIALGVVPAGTKLAPRPPGMPAWDSLTPAQKRLYARQMEAFAASLTYADAQFGRIVDKLRETGQLDNTLIAIMPDNGAAGEGAPHGTYNEELMPNGIYPSEEENAKFEDVWGTHQTYPAYSVYWAVAGNTPYRYYKQTTFEGGVRVPLFISWPKGIAAHGEKRDQFVHIIDVTPTILDAVGVKPESLVHGVPQSPFDGVSFTSTFTDPHAPPPHKVQYFEMFGNRALWDDGWKGVVLHRPNTWDMAQDTPFTGERWQLFDLKTDPTETTDVAAQHPDKVREIERLFDEQARRYQVYPLLNIGDARKDQTRKRMADFAAHGGVWDYSGEVQRIPEALAPPISALSFTADAKLDLAKSGANGVIYAIGGKFGGMSFYVLDGRPTFSFVNQNLRTTKIQSDASVPAGPVDVKLVFTRAAPRETGGAEVKILVGDRQVAAGSVPGPIPGMFSVNEEMGVGVDTGTPASLDYESSPHFDGEIKDLRFEFHR